MAAVGCEEGLVAWVLALGGDGRLALAEYQAGFPEIITAPLR